MKLLALGVLLGFLIALGGDVFAHRDDRAGKDVRARSDPSETKSPLSAAEAAQLAEVLDRVQREYVDTVSHPELVDDALRGVVGGLDPYSSYLDAEEYADLRVSTAGTYAGIGIEVSTADRALRVVRPFRDSPAAAAGIRSGDMISAIDGTAGGRRSRRRHGAHAWTARLHRQARGDAHRPEPAARIHRRACAGRRAQRGHGETRRRLSIRAHHEFQRYDRRRLRLEHRAAASRHAVEAARRGARPAQQPRRRARVRGRSGRPVARDGRHRHRRWPHARRALHHGSDTRAKCCPACRWSSW